MVLNGSWEMCVDVFRLLSALGEFLFRKALRRVKGVIQRNSCSCTSLRGPPGSVFSGLLVREGSWCDSSFQEIYQMRTWNGAHDVTYHVPREVPTDVSRYAHVTARRQGHHLE